MSKANALPTDVAIIGAGLAGIALALALHQQQIPCQIFEARSHDAPELASGVVLTPNGLRVLEALGVFERITDKCWHATHRTYKNDKDETTKKTLITSKELYGYPNHRLWRRLLLTEMKLMLQEQGINVQYKCKFDSVHEDNDNEVIFSINGETKRTAMLVGTDGIFSSVRKYLYPDVQPEYTGVIGTLAHIRRDAVKWPYPDYEPACTIQGKPGAFFMMPEDPEAKEVMVGMQVRRPESNRAEWDALSKDKDQLAELFRKGYDEWHDTAKQVIDQVCKEKDSIYLWPFLKMPKLDTWFSATGRVVILGDSAHAIPPSSGQGVNQSLEDVQSFVLLLTTRSDRMLALRQWQDMRQKRIDTVFDWATNATNIQRLPSGERDRLIREGIIKDPKTLDNFDDMSWLYAMDVKEEVAKLS